MGIITIVVLALTALGLGFGALWGCGRGLRRATLRLGLVVFSIVLAILLRGVLTDILLDIKIDGEPINEMLAEAFSEGDLPESLQNLIMALIKSVIGMVGFIVLFIVLRLITWMIVYPICKIWVKKGPKIQEEEVPYEQAVENGYEGTEEEYALTLAKKKPRYKKRRGYGALVGLAQGIIIAFVTFSPLTGMLVQVDKISRIELQGEAVFELPEEVGITQYVESAPGKVYNTIGGWFFDSITTVKDEEGNKVSIGDAVDIVDAVAGVAASIEDLTEHFETLSSETATDQERIDALDSLGAGLVEAGNALDNLDADSRQMLEGLIDSVKDLISESGDMDPEMETVINNLSLDSLDLSAAGSALQGISTLLNVTEYEGEETVTQEDVNNIVNGIAKNPLILDMVETIGEEDVVFIPTDEDEFDDYRDWFVEAVENAELADEGHRETLRTFFGL
ncbi:MAG: hypothetical protein E7363_04795 [Clostridiales bacterium]|nr:hypothetical protein [Clostridiales bacterium]